MERVERKMRKLQNLSIERVHWRAVDKEMLGLAPRLWMEVLDKEHRYATLLQEYWRRWQLSDTRDNFFTWLDHGQGALVDLPQAPKRLLEEWRVVYLNREQQRLFSVRIEQGSGRFLWEADDSPVTVPAPLVDSKGKTLPSTQRERDIAAIIDPLLEKSRRRDQLLARARAQAELARSRGEEASDGRLAEIAAPLVEEGLLCQLRDPFFHERLDAAPTPNGHAHMLAMPRIPSELLPGVGWEELLAAIAHDELRFMKGSASRLREEKGIFVLDSFSPLYCGTKLRGTMHHSSFVRGHCVRVAGGIKIVDGWLRELSPHSGHYQPSQELIDDMIEDWKSKGVSFSGVKVCNFVKS